MLSDADLDAVVASYQAMSQGKTGTWSAEWIAKVRGDVAMLADEVRRLRKDARYVAFTWRYNAENLYAWAWDRKQLLQCASELERLVEGKLDLGQRGDR